MRARFCIEGHPSDYYYDSELPFIPDKGMDINGLPGLSDGPFEVEKSEWMHKESYLLIFFASAGDRAVDWSNEKEWEARLSGAGWVKGNAYCDPFNSLSEGAPLNSLGFFERGPFLSTVVTRVENCLVCNDILLVKDLEKLSAKDFNNIKNFGKESFRFVEYACNRLKIKLRKGEGRP